MSAHMKSKVNNYMQEPDVSAELQSMLDDTTFNTLPGYSIDIELYPNHEVPFVENHLNYLKKRPQLNPAHYLSNLRLMLKVR